MEHQIESVTRNLQGCFSRERPPILTIGSGDTLTCRTLDAGWGLDPFAEDVLGKRIPLAQRPDPANDTGHCLVGPIAVRGAQPGQVLQVDICQLVPASVGATWVGEVQEFLPQLGVEGYFYSVPMTQQYIADVRRSSSVFRPIRIARTDYYLAISGTKSFRWVTATDTVAVAVELPSLTV